MAVKENSWKELYLGASSTLEGPLAISGQQLSNAALFDLLDA